MTQVDKRPALLAFHPLPADTDSVFLEVRIARTSAPIGTIRWKTEWRKYAFYPSPGGSYTREVLMAVNRKLYRLMYEWRKTHPNPRRGLAPLSHSERKALAQQQEKPA
jgi:hypothetical protein